MLAKRHFRGMIPYYLEDAQPSASDDVSTANVEVEVQEVDCKYACSASQSSGIACSGWEAWATHLAMDEEEDLYDTQSRNELIGNDSASANLFMPIEHVDASIWGQVS